MVANATGCVEVCTRVYPYTAWRVPWINNGFEDAAATISGVETAYKAIKRRGDLPARKAIEARVPGKAKEINRRVFERGGGVEISRHSAALNRHRLRAHGGLYQA